MEDSNLDFVINGELYVKRGPSIFKSADHLESLNDEINDIEFDTSKENPDFRKLPLLDAYRGLKDMVTSWDGKLDYSGTDSFWQLSTYDGVNLKLTECMASLKNVEAYKSKKDLDKDFVKLSQFLNKATFVGREFKRTKPTKTSTGKDDRSYMWLFDGDKAYLNGHCIVLYARLVFG